MVTAYPLRASSYRRSTRRPENFTKARLSDAMMQFITWTQSCVRVIKRPFVIINKHEIHSGKPI